MKLRSETKQNKKNSQSQKQKSDINALRTIIDVSIDFPNCQYCTFHYISFYKTSLLQKLKKKIKSLT